MPDRTSPRDPPGRQCPQAFSSGELRPHPGPHPQETQGGHERQVHRPLNQGGKGRHPRREEVEEGRAGGQKEEGESKHGQKNGGLARETESPHEQEEPLPEIEKPGPNIRPGLQSEAGAPCGNLSQATLRRFRTPTPWPR